MDALYQAYLSACLILLGMKTRLDPGLPPVWWRKRTPLGSVTSISRGAFGADARGGADVVAEGFCPGG